MNNKEKLIDIWHALNDVQSDLQGIGERDLVKYLQEALDAVAEEIDEYPEEDEE